MTWIFVFYTSWYAGVMYSIPGFKTRESCESFKTQLAEGHPHGSTLKNYAKCVPMEKP